ncbi:MAG: hypothetical protein A3F41_01005 [Coxiella sp. RIFCSPHIGHO2_12_FULL_44_14]|nr:MAG: hypothetical protein A3F41_01005 [Coxiella sp. RIFCSPHIGHO2_12_FULL_44_14]
MSVLGWIVLFLGVTVILAFQRASLWVWLIAMAACLTGVSVWSELSTVTTVVLWLCLVGIVIVFGVLPVRRRFISRFMLNLYRKKMPTLSATEQEALTAGTVGWEGELFSGKPNWSEFRRIPKGQLSKEERDFLEGPVETLCGLVDNWKINQLTFTIPEIIWNFLKENGFFGLIIPKEYGGKAFSALGHSQVITKVASVSIAVATVVSVPNSLGPAELLLHYGTKEQKEYYLPRLARGEEIPCFALTSPVAGSDAGSIMDYGVVCQQLLAGEKRLGIRLNWDKRYITLAPVATLLGLAFKLYDPEHWLGDREALGITCALIPTTTPGVVIGRRHFPLRCAFPNGPTQGKDVFIPLDWIIGGVAMAGHGWRMLMESLAAGRSISLPSMATGGSKRVFYATGAYARIREQFNTYIGAFGGVQEALARIGGHTYLIEATRLFTVTALDRGQQPAVASAISKYHTTELSRSIINDAMDIHGGKGICMGPHNYLAQTYIESPISITVEGANILTRSMIIFGQGAIRCHPFILKEITAAQNNDLRAFDRALFGHIGLIISNKVRAFLLSVSKGHWASVPRGPLKRYYQQFSQFSAVFALLADMAMLSIGGALKRKEKLSSRLGDLLGFLYLGSAVIKYYELENEEEAWPLVQWVCEDLLYRIQTQIDGFLSNMPNRWLAWSLRWIVFPLGRRLQPPLDQLNGHVAKLLLYPSRVRSRLSQHVYTQNTPFNPVGLIDEILREVIAAEPLEKKLHQALRQKIIQGNTVEEWANSAVNHCVLTAEEAVRWLAAYRSRLRMTNVDDFTVEELT